MRKVKSRAYNRDVSRRKALRKQRIAKEIYYNWGNVLVGDPSWEYYDNLHQYSKNTIHCSCPCCSSKTRNKGRRKRGNYQRALNYKLSDLKKIIRMDEEEMEYLGNKTKRPNRCKYESE